MRVPGHTTFVEVDALDIEVVGRVGLSVIPMPITRACVSSSMLGRLGNVACNLFCGSAGGCGELLCGDGLARAQQFQQRLGERAEIGRGAGVFEGGIEPALRRST